MTDGVRRDGWCIVMQNGYPFPYLITRPTTPPVHVPFSDFESKISIKTACAIRNNTKPDGILFRS